MELWSELLSILAAQDWRVCFWDLPSERGMVRVWRFVPPMDATGRPVGQPMIVFGTPQDEDRVRLIIADLAARPGFTWEWTE